MAGPGASACWVSSPRAVMVTSYLTIVESNQSLMVASRGPQV
jgi:hypothetical protein